MKLNLVRVVFSISLIILAVNCFGQVSNREALQKLLNGKSYHITFEGHDILLNDTEEAFYDHFIIEFKGKGVFIKKDRTKDLNFENALKAKPIMTTYTLKDSVLKLSDLPGWEIIINKSPLKLILSSTIVYNQRLPLIEITKK